MKKPYYQDDLGVIYCGDCLEIMKDLPDKSVDLVLTDPPYGHKNKDGDMSSNYKAIKGIGDYIPSRDNRPIVNDGEEANEIYYNCLPIWSRILVSGGCCCCCCCGGGPDPQFARWSLWMDKHIPFKMCVIWFKGFWGLGHHYRRCWECILVGQKGGSACKWHIDTTVPNIILEDRKPKELNELHPTVKPIALMSKFIKWHSTLNDTILDPFLGSGTTAVAAKMLGRRYIGIEISEEYCEIAKKRLIAVDTGVPVKEQNAGQLSLFESEEK